MGLISTHQPILTKQYWLWGVGTERAYLPRKYSQKLQEYPSPSLCDTLGIYYNILFIHYSLDYELSRTAEHLLCFTKVVIKPSGL